MSNETPKPMFASASAQNGGNSQGDDFDLNEIFADYFISEFEDPMNAYTSSMANYGGAAAAVAMTQQPNASGAQNAAAAQNAVVQNAAAQLHAAAQSAAAAPAPAGSSEQLPTGGIRTAFHTAVTQQPLQHFQHAPPPQKKPKLETGAVAQAPTAVQIPAPPPATIAAPGGGITSRLGVPLPLQSIPGIAGAFQSQILAQPNQQLQSQTQQPGTQTANGITLPVGVGIRLGGAGGVAPTTAQNAQRAGYAGQYALWGNQQQAGVSDQAIAERRQRNREHAKRSRVRKKFMLESLQEQVMSLQKENLNLRTLIQDNIPEHAQKIISECCNTNPLFADTKAEQGKERQSATLVRSDFSLMESLSSGQQNFVLSDPRLPDNPIVFATPGFYKLTGYTQEQVLGRNCRFLQGPGTNPKAVDIIRKAVATGSDCTTCILNYKADGTPFWNQFFVAALRDSDNCIVNYVGVQTEIEPEAGANALEDRVNAVLPLQNKEDETGIEGDHADLAKAAES